MVCNSEAFDQLGVDVQNFLWALADHAAKTQVSSNLRVTDFRQPS